MSFVSQNKPKGGGSESQGTLGDAALPLKGDPQWLLPWPVLEHPDREVRLGGAFSPC